MRAFTNPTLLLLAGFGLAVGIVIGVIALQGNTSGVPDPGPTATKPEAGGSSRGVDGDTPGVTHPAQRP